MRQLGASIFGKPDGFFVRLRCRFRGHYWQVCGDDCCEGDMEWCKRCLGCRVA